MSEYEYEEEHIFNTEEDYKKFLKCLSEYERMKLFQDFLEDPKKYPAVLIYGIGYTCDEYSEYDGHYIYPEDVEAERIEKLKQKAEFLLSFIVHMEDKYAYYLQEDVTTLKSEYTEFRNVDYNEVLKIAEKFVGL